MKFLEFNSAGNLIRYGTFNKNERLLNATNIMVHIEEIPVDVSKLYYDSRSDTVKQYTEIQYAEKQKYTVFDGEWSNLSMTYSLFNNPETQWIVVKLERDRRLQATDWTQLPDVPLPTKEKWAVYRQALRDITQQPDPFNIVWPEPPQ